MPPLPQRQIAIAGGSSKGLGVSIVNAILESATCVPIILSRAKGAEHPDGSTSKDSRGVEIRYVDYASVQSLTAALNRVHTLLSVVLALDGTWLQTQLNLLAAARAAGAKRFAPSEWALGPKAHHILSPMFDDKLQWWQACRQAAAEARAQGESFEVARFHNGFLMNYLGYWAPFEHNRALGGRHEDDDRTWFFFFCEGRVDIPEREGGGIPSITLTDLVDVGRFVAASVELPEGEWEEEMGMAGETLSFDKVIRIYEEAIGKKIETTIVPRAEYERRVKVAKEKADPLSVLEECAGLVYCEDEIDFGIIDPVLNRKFPQIKPMDVRTLIERFHAGKYQ